MRAGGEGGRNRGRGIARRGVEDVADREGPRRGDFIVVFAVVESGGEARLTSG